MRQHLHPRLPILALIPIAPELRDSGCMAHFAKAHLPIFIGA
jgi:hypothetical protein